MSSTFTQGFPIAAAAQPGVSTVARGPVALPGQAPAPTTLWSPPLPSSEDLPAGAAYDIQLSPGLSADPVVVEVVMRLGVGGRLIRVDEWLSVSAAATAAGVTWEMSAAFGEETLEESSSDATHPAGQWVRIQLLISSDQLALVVAGVAHVRILLARRFIVPAPMATVTVENSDPANKLGLAVVSISDLVPDDVASALATAESVGQGEVRGAFYRVGKGILGGEVSAEQAVPGGRMQEFEEGVAYWSARSGGVALDGPVALRYKDMGRHTGALGLPLSDTQAGTAPYATRTRDAKPTNTADTSQLARFEHGAIAWSAATGAHEVLGPVAAHWLVLGGPASALGLPLGSSSYSDYGHRHSFQFGDIFEHPRGGRAALHGRIRDRYDELGELSGPLGAPRTDVTPVRTPTGAVTKTTVAAFDRGSIFDHPETGTVSVPDEWDLAYEEAGGATGPLGRPLSEVQDGANNVSWMEFEHGLLVKHPSASAIKVVTTVEVTMTRAMAPKIDDGYQWSGWTPSKDHNAELITWVSILRDGVPLNGWDKRRFPGTGYDDKFVDFGNATASIPVTASTQIGVVCGAEDWDWLSGNDTLGGITRSYGIDTLWGEQGPNGPTYRETGSGGDGDVEYEYSIGLPTGQLTGEFRKDRWWQFTNSPSADLSYAQYAEAFEDVEAHGSWWDIVNHPLDHLFFELAIQGITGTGNCFGMSKLALRTLCHQTAYRLPLSRYGTARQPVNDPAFPAPLRHDVNIAHAQQLDAAILGYCLAEATAGAVNTLAEHARILTTIDSGSGNDLAVVSMLSTFLGSGHSVLAYESVPPSSGYPHRILIAEPYTPWDADADKTHSRIEFEQNGDWRYYRDDQPGGYSSAEGSHMFHIPPWVLRLPSITPMAALGMGVEQLLQSFIVVGADADHEGVHGVGGGGSTMRPMPHFQTDESTAIYAADGPTPPGARTILIARRGGDAGVYFRSPNVAAGVSFSFDRAGVNGQVEVNGFDGRRRPGIEVSIPQPESRAQLHIGTTTGRAQRPGWSSTLEGTLDPHDTASFTLTPIGVGVALAGLGNGPTPTLRLHRQDTRKTSTFVLDDAIAGTRMEIAPADMASPFGTQRLRGLGPDILVNPS